MFHFAEIKARGLNWRLVWDLWMILFSIVNLLLISFDLTYLTFRSHYKSVMPELTELYDPVKGVADYTLTEDYLQLTKRLLAKHRKEGDQANTSYEQKLLQKFSLQMLERNPFVRSEQPENLRIVLLRLEHKLAQERGFSGEMRWPPEKVFAEYWTLSPTNAVARLEYFEEQVRDLFAANYDRSYDLDGDFPDLFWKLDLPFLLFFLLEFLTAWYLAVTRKLYLRWFLYPLYHWYDLLGLIPMGGFRVFRLFRIVSIYMRLHRSELMKVGNGFVSRTVRHYSNILTEEISDKVTLNVLSQMQAEVRSGSSSKVLQGALEEHRAGLRRLALEGAERILEDKALIASLRESLRISLEQSIAKADVLRLMPAALVQGLMRQTGEVVFDSILGVLVAGVESDEGREMLGVVVDHLLDRLLSGMGDAEFQDLTQEIVVEFLENLKRDVAVKRWAS